MFPLRAGHERGNIHTNSVKSADPRRTKTTNDLAMPDKTNEPQRTRRAHVSRDETTPWLSAKHRWRQFGGISRWGARKRRRDRFLSVLLLIAPPASPHPYALLRSPYLAPTPSPPGRSLSPSPPAASFSFAHLSPRILSARPVARMCGILAVLGFSGDPQAKRVRVLELSRRQFPPFFPCSPSHVPAANACRLWLLSFLSFFF